VILARSVLSFSGIRAVEPVATVKKKALESLKPWHNRSKNPQTCFCGGYDWGLRKVAPDSTALTPLILDLALNTK